MRCIIAHSPFYLLTSDVQRAVKDVKPETLPGPTVVIDRRTYPVRQVGEILTRLDRRDFTVGEVSRALTRLGFTCHNPAATAPALTPLQAAAALLGPVPQR